MTATDIRALYEWGDRPVVTGLPPMSAQIAAAMAYKERAELPPLKQEPETPRRRKPNTMTHEILKEFSADPLTRWTDDDAARYLRGLGFSTTRVKTGKLLRNLAERMKVGYIAGSVKAPTPYWFHRDPPVSAGIIGPKHQTAFQARRGAP
jgi:hypothetical protein